MHSIPLYPSLAQEEACTPFIFSYLSMIPPKNIFAKRHMAKSFALRAAPTEGMGNMESKTQKKRNQQQVYNLVSLP